MSPVKVAIFVDLFPPSMGGGATRAFQIAQSLATLGYDVTVITGSYIYPRGKSLFILKWSYEKTSNINICRVPSINLPFKGLLNRLLNYLICSIFMLITAPKIKGFNIIFSLGMHPFTDFSAYLVKLINPRSRLVVDFSDIFPINTIYGIVSNATNRILLKIADFVTVHNDSMKKIFVYLYKPTKKIAILYNSIDTNNFIPRPEMRKEKKILNNICARSLSNKIVVSYFGVFGSFQRLDNVLKVAAHLQDQEKCEHIVFCMIGDGEKRPLLESLASNLKNVCICKPVRRELIPIIAAESDVGLVPVVTTDLFLQYVISPQKASEFLSCGVPILAPKGSFIGNLISKWNAGYVVDFSNIEDICKCLKNICQNPGELEIKSINARLLATSIFSTNALRRTLLQLLIEIFKQIIENQK